MGGNNGDEKKKKATARNVGNRQDRKAVNG
jgi:hypothetical protein